LLLSVPERCTGHCAKHYTKANPQGAVRYREDDSPDNHAKRGAYSDVFAILLSQSNFPKGFKSAL
jgi:hypothetical protein